MVPLPNLVQKFVNGAGNLIQPFVSYLQQFTIAPPPFVDVIATGSPFIYEVKEPGNLYIAGGVVSDISLNRGSVTLNIATSTANARIIPVAISDNVIITYTVQPVIRFIPSYGSNTNS